MSADHALVADAPSREARALCTAMLRVGFPITHDRAERVLAELLSRDWTLSRTLAGEREDMAAEHEASARLSDAEGDADWADEQRGWARSDRVEAARHRIERPRAAA